MKFLTNEQFDAPPTFDYYKYIGSLTTPPCEEYVNLYSIRLFGL